MNAQETAATIRDCFLMAILRAARLQTGGRLMVVGSDFYRSCWPRPGERVRGEESARKQPLEVLTEARDWLANCR